MAAPGQQPLAYIPVPLLLRPQVVQLRAEGRIGRDLDLGHLSPALYGHVNSYGKYRFEIEARAPGLRPLKESGKRRLACDSAPLLSEPLIVRMATGIWGRVRRRRASGGSSRSGVSCCGRANAPRVLFDPLDGLALLQRLSLEFFCLIALSTESSLVLLVRGSRMVEESALKGVPNGRGKLPKITQPCG